MRNPIATLFAFFSGQNRERKQNLNTRRLVARYSRGNVSLQADNFTTQSQKDELKRKVLAHKYS